jgi:hypothetical protein
MYFKTDIIFIQQVAEFVSDIHRFPNFSDHALTKAEGFLGLFVMDKHESALFLPEENDDGGKLGRGTADLVNQCRYTPSTGSHLRSPVRR